MWKFLKRQFKTKTGKLGMALIAGTVATQVIGPESTGMAMTVANQLLTPETCVLGLAAMLLRDKDAKEGT